MSASQIFLVTVSGLGVLHGLFLAILLWVTTKGNLQANRLLAVLLLVLSFRVGKSVFLEFLDDLDIRFIFTGLGTLMAIGPLFYFYAKAKADQAFQWTNRYLWHFAPCFAAIIFGLVINVKSLEALPKALLLIPFLSYYSHYLIYLIKAKMYISERHRAGLSHQTYRLLTLLFYGLLIIWVAYVLNLFDESVPYVMGPLLYTVVAYIISFIVISRGYLLDSKQEKYRTTRVSDQQMDKLFSRICTLIINEKQYKNPDLTLKSLSATLKVSTQVLSMVINQKSQKNFNAFVNYYRVEEAIQLLQDPNYQNHTIATIAYEAGFNSVSSFNRAFKKQTNKTPQAYRSYLTK